MTTLGDIEMLWGIETRWLFVALLALVVLERVVELVVTKRHVRRLRERGGVVVGERHYAVMVAMHTAFLVAAPLEIFLLDRPFHPLLAAVAISVVVLTMSLRYWAIASLGDRWTAQVVVVPGEPPKVGGPYRYLRHPNYLAVVFEIAALPLVHTAWATALLFSIANAFVLRTRIRVEEAALAEHSDYLEHLGHRPRFLPFQETETKE